MGLSFNIIPSFLQIKCNSILLHFDLYGLDLGQVQCVLAGWGQSMRGNIPFQFSIFISDSRPAEGGREGDIDRATIVHSNTSQATRIQGFRS